MNSLIEYIVSNRDNKELLAQVWCDFNFLKFPDMLPQEYKPKWWDEEIKKITSTNPVWDEMYNYSQERFQEGQRWGFGEPIQDYIKTIVPIEEIRETERRYLLEKYNYIAREAELSI
jgi:hypothetical protein